MSAMSFGLFIPQGWRFDLAGIDAAEHWATMLGLAQRADAGPWDSLWVYDHMHTSPEPSHEPTYEAWSLMAALAASTRRIRLGQMCTCVGYRNPMLLAKMAATIDHISAGRLEMGIGAGWYEHEWRAYGYGFPRAGERLAMLEEAVQVMGQAWRDGEVDHDGEHYVFNGAICQPLPRQAGGIPLWVAGGGERVTLRIAAQYASHTNFDGSPQAFAHKSRVLAAHCAELGTDVDAIVRSANYNVIIGEDDRDVGQRLARYERRLRSAGLGPASIERQIASVRGLPGHGTPAQVADRLRELRQIGMTYGIFYFPEAAYDTTGIELFEREVIPRLR